jgi:ElaB/YqjD/DUF883 family membrane-anchored ribosome-binding protein
MQDPTPLAANFTNQGAAIEPLPQEHAASGLASAATDIATAGLQSLKKQAGIQVEHAVSALQHSRPVQQANEYVTQQPVKSLLVAFGMGIIVGICLRH